MKILNYLKYLNPFYWYRYTRKYWLLSGLPKTDYYPVPTLKTAVVERYEDLLVANFPSDINVAIVKKDGERCFAHYFKQSMSGQWLRMGDVDTNNLPNT